MDEIDRRKPLVGGGQNDEQKPEKKPSKVGMVLGIMFLLALVLIVGYFGVITLVRKSDVRAQTEGDKYKYQNGEWTSFQAYYSLTWGETTTYRHTISMIPTAYEHYFLVADKDLINYVLVRADKNWYEKNFEEGVAIDPEGVTVTGYVRRTDSEVANDVSDRVKTLTAEIRHNHPGFWGFNGTTASIRLRPALRFMRLLCALFRFSWEFCFLCIAKPLRRHNSIQRPANASAPPVWSYSLFMPCLRFMRCRLCKRQECCGDAVTAAEISRICRPARWRRGPAED